MILYRYSFKFDILGQFLGDFIILLNCQPEHHRGRHAGGPQQGIPQRHGHQGGRGHHPDTQARVE